MNRHLERKTCEHQDNRPRHHTELCHKFLDSRTLMLTLGETMQVTMHAHKLQE
jgi:hypothetical protein